MPIFTSTSFKRLAVGVTFTCAAKGAPTYAQRFRKTSERGAYRLLPSGRGQTHAEVPFARSHSVAV
jgi:hypothetical protein